MPFKYENADLSKIMYTKRNSMANPLEGIDIDGAVERGTQVNSEADRQMITQDTNTEVHGDVHCIIRKTLQLMHPLIYDQKFKLLMQENVELLMMIS